MQQIKDMAAVATAGLMALVVALIAAALYGVVSLVASFFQR